LSLTPATQQQCVNLTGPGTVLQVTAVLGGVAGVLRVESSRAISVVVEYGALLSVDGAGALGMGTAVVRIFLPSFFGDVQLFHSQISSEGVIFRICSAALTVVLSDCVVSPVYFLPFSTSFTSASHAPLVPSPMPTDLCARYCRLHHRRRPARCNTHCIPTRSSRS
jgi:hypothetical protein